LQAGQSIKLLPGTRILRTVESFVAKISECNAINNPCYNYFANKMDYNSDEILSTKPNNTSQQSSNFESQIYPNPTTGSISITISGLVSNVSSVIIFNIIGEHVFEQHFVSVKISDEKFEIKNLNLVDGIYFVKVINGEDSGIHRLLVSKN